LLTVISCSTSKSSFDKALLAGHWLTSRPETTPDIIIDDKQNLFLLLEDSTSSDTLNFTYSIKRNVMTLYTGKLWVSKNKIVKLTADTLIYIRNGDKEAFYYGRKKTSTSSVTNAN
jgi:hypothetical protein